MNVIQGCILLFEQRTGKMLAVIDATSVTAIRTAAASAVATRVLARSDRVKCGVLGTGVQGYAHVRVWLACYWTCT